MTFQKFRLVRACVKWIIGPTASNWHILLQIMLVLTNWGQNSCRWEATEFLLLCLRFLNSVRNWKLLLSDVCLEASQVFLFQALSMEILFDIFFFNFWRFNCLNSWRSFNKIKQTILDHLEFFCILLLILLNRRYLIL